MSWTWVPQGRSNVGFYGDDVPIFYSEPVPVAALRLLSVAPGVALRKPLFCIQTAAIKANCWLFSFNPIYFLYSCPGALLSIIFHIYIHTYIRINLDFTSHLYVPWNFFFCPLFLVIFFRERLHLYWMKSTEAFNTIIFCPSLLSLSSNSVIIFSIFNSDAHFQWLICCTSISMLNHTVRNSHVSFHCISDIIRFKLSTDLPLIYSLPAQLCEVTQLMVPQTERNKFLQHATQCTCLNFPYSLSI